MPDNSMRVEFEVIAIHCLKCNRRLSGLRDNLAVQRFQAAHPHREAYLWTVLTIRPEAMAGWVMDMRLRPAKVGVSTPGPPTTI